MDPVAKQEGTPFANQSHGQRRGLTSDQAGRGFKSRASLLRSPRAFPGLLWLGVMGIMGGCSDSQDLLDWETSEGIPLGSLATDTAERVILIFDPAESLACYSGLGAWLHWGRHGDRTVMLVLTRDPAPVERRALLLSGLRESAVLERRGTNRTPIQIYIRSGSPPRVEYRITDGSAFDFIASINGAVI
jgi:hypothetical protein